jgi:hypothetical protein
MAANWPNTPSGKLSEQALKRFEGEVALASAAAQDQLDLDDETAKKLYAELLTLSTQSVERSRKSAELIQAAAVAIGGLYTGILGFIFVAKDNPMPWRGIWPTLFFGLAVVLAMSYVAFITRTPGVAEPKPPATDDAQKRMMRRAYFYTQVTRALVYQRAHLLRAAVVSLGVGVFLLPLPFLEIGDMSLPFTGAAEPSASAEADASEKPADGGAAPPSGAPIASAVAAAPSSVAWPTPQFTEPPRLAAILYQAQVDAHKEALDGDGNASGPSDSDSTENWIAVGLALVGGAAVLLAILKVGPFGDSGTVRPKARTQGKTKTTA